ncbi:U-box domain-containing protein 52-like isoform X2 [Andrographis paniculata]|uniref:U-box domain-containing protein 52-like isoform X2 n=1 Tax=Andrographis paniculata TaxID=175694 RepID=UPI0021E74369|nr:U-box domain-containing protein 52-like isoform X2 [Andrographis paniculata]
MTKAASTPSSGPSRISSPKAKLSFSFMSSIALPRLCVHSYDVVLEDDTDIAKAIIEYVAHAAIESLVLGASRHGFIRKLKMIDVPSLVAKGAPDFCTVYVISKTKISSVRNASRQAPFTSPLMPKIQQIQEQSNNTISPIARPKQLMSMRGVERTPRKSNFDETDLVKSPMSRGHRFRPNMFTDFAESDTDISFVGSGTPSERPSVDRSSLHFDTFDSGRTSRVSTSSESSFGSMRSAAKWSEISSFTDYSTPSVENDDVAAEMRRLKLELQKTMEMYSTACKEALTAKEKAMELHQWRIDEERRLEETRLAEETARQTAEQEKSKYKAAMENTPTSGGEDMMSSSLRYKRYTIEEIEEATEFFSESRKIGEGGYGPVYKCYLDHTRVAVKVLRPDAAQGRSQFQREVEVLSCLRHPNMVLLLGACPEYGCLVYEYMANGSLDDCLFRKGNTRPLSWQVRFRIAAEIATGLNFLHQTKPEPLVHRDLKPGNILLDQNYTSKISDVGLARLVPPSVADDVTQYRMTSTAGTFCYIDPEYQQTGMLGVKSDVYSLGIVLLQILTAKTPMGLSHLIEQAIEKGTLEEMLDPSISDWPIEETTTLAKLAVQCSELRRKDRPDLGKVVLPELNKLREFGEENIIHFLVGGSTAPSPSHSLASIKEVKSDHSAATQSEVNASASTTSLSKNSSETTE